MARTGLKALNINDWYSLVGTGLKALILYTSTLIGARA